MGDITSTCTLKVQAQLGGLNLAIIKTVATADDGDTIELDTLLDANGGLHVKQVKFAVAELDPTGTALLDPIIYSDTTDTLTLGGSTDNKRRDILVAWV